MHITQTLRFILLTLVLGMGQAHAQDSAVYDANQNLWNLYYQDPETEQWVNKTYEARTAVRPSIKSKIVGNGSQFSYQYIVHNKRGAKQKLSVIRIWGIPLVYTIPNLPPISANVKTDAETEDKQQWAQLKVKREFENRVVKAPKGWSAGLRVEEREGQTSFVWTPGLKDTDPDGIEPGGSQGEFAVLRPELPGVARTYLQGSIEEPWGLDGLPDTPFWTAKVDEIQELDYLLVSVLAPIIPVPDPYNGAELVRRIKAHVQTWLKYGHINADVLGRLNRQFDVLVPALEMNNKLMARTAVSAIRKECTDRNAGLSDDKAGQDDDGYDSEALPRTPAQRGATPAVALDRVAARALMFDLRYVMDRMDSGR
jgi:hypothetical protein